MGRYFYSGISENQMSSERAFILDLR